MNSWHVSLALTFVLGFLMTVVIEAWSSTHKVTLLPMIRFTTATFAVARPALKGSRVEMLLSNEKSLTENVQPARGQASRLEPGSWVLAATGFALIAFRQTDILPYVPLGLSPARFVLLAGAGLWILTRLTGQRSGYRMGALGPILSIYALALMLAYAAQMTRPGVEPNIDSIFVVEILIIVVVPFCFTVIHGYVGLMRVIKGLVAGAVVSALLALQQGLTGATTGPQLRLPGLVDGAGISFTVDDVFRGGMVRGQGSASHPLELACVLSVIFPLALALTLSLRAAGKRWWPWAVATAIIAAGVAVTLSRSGMIGLLVGLAVMACYWPIRRTLAALAVVVGLVSIGLLFQLPFLTKYLSIFSADSSVAQRAAVTSALPFDISLFGTFSRATGARPSGAGVPTLDDQYLKTLSETGVFGLIAFLTLVVTTLVLAFHAFRNARNRTNPRLPLDAAQLFIGIAASFSAYAIVSIFLDMGGFPQIWTLMWVLIALSAAAYRISRAPDGQDLDAGISRHMLGQAEMSETAGAKRDVIAR